MLGKIVFPHSCMLSGGLHILFDFCRSRLNFIIPGPIIAHPHRSSLVSWLKGFLGCSSIRFCRPYLCAGFNLGCLLMEEGFYSL